VKNFEYAAPHDAREAASLLGSDWKTARLIGGGTDLLDQLKERTVETGRIVHLHAAPLNYVRLNRGSVVIGATTTLATIESDPIIKANLPGLMEAAASIATPQIRNVGTLGGNLCQRPRCWYYRNAEFPCLKKGGDICFAHEGANKYNAILGGGPSYIVHPSDTAPMLVAFGASVRLVSPRGERTVPLERFFQLPADNLDRENVLTPDEVLVEVIIPRPPAGTRSAYYKIKERETQDFALASAAVVLSMDGDRVRGVRIVMGGVAPIPWRSNEAEAVLKGKPLTEAAARSAAEAALKDAAPLSDNAYKVSLAKTAVHRAVMAAAGQA